MTNTVYSIAKGPQEVTPTMILLGMMGLVACTVQLVLDKRLSKRIPGRSITFRQSLGQKNSTVAIWLAQNYLNPSPSIVMAAYSIWQNLLNTYQIHQAAKRSGKKQPQR